MKIYIVFGTSGEYSDRSEWAVAAYEVEANAEAHVTAAKKWLQENVNLWEIDWNNLPENPYDPYMRLDGGCEWFVYDTELRKKLPSAARPMKKEPAPEPQP